MVVFLSRLHNSSTLLGGTLQLKIFNSKLTLGQSTVKNWTKKTEIHEKTAINSGQFLKIKCLKPIYFSQHHKEAKILI